MRTYETTFIINPQSDDSAIDQHVKAVTDLISDNGGNILRENHIGTRRLAYDIQKLSQGFYTDLIFDGPKEVLDVLDRFYKLEEPYIRHLTVRFEGELPPEQPQGYPDGDEDVTDKDDKKEAKEDEEEKEEVKEPGPVETAEEAVEPETTEDTQPIEVEDTETAPIKAEPVAEETTPEPTVTEEPSGEPEKPAAEDDIL